MPPFVLLLLQLLPYLPGIIRAVESIHGDTSGKGAEKLQSAVSLVQAVVPAVVDHLKNEPENTPKLESLIGTVVAGINAADTWHSTNGIPQQPSA